MSTFSTELPSTESGARKFKTPITLFLKPNSSDNENERYRFRILNFLSPEKSERTHPFISRYVHNHWGVNDNGMKIVDDYIVCPSSPMINAKEDETLGFTEAFREIKLKEKKFSWDCVCPCCRHVGEAWNSWRNSGKTDRLALERANSLKRVFQGIVPVYVVNDPVTPKNSGKFKCIIFTNPKEYKTFIDIVNRERAKIRMSGNTYSWCNGENAVDFYLRIEKSPVIWNEGKPNESRGFERKITLMKFGTKVYTLRDNDDKDIITQEAIDSFEFDEQFYVKHTKTQNEEFYKKYYGAINKNIPSEDDDILSDDNDVISIQKKPVIENVQIPQNQSKPKITVSNKDIDDLLSDPDDLLADEPVERHNHDVEDTNMDDLMKELDFND